MFSGSEWSVLCSKFITDNDVQLFVIHMPTLPEHLSLLPVFRAVCVTRSLVLCACFVDCCLSFCTFSFDHCVVCSSSIYRFWLPLWHLQTLLHMWSRICSPSGAPEFTSVSLTCLNVWWYIWQNHWVSLLFQYFIYEIEYIKII